MPDVAQCQLRSGLKKDKCIPKMLFQVGESGTLQEMTHMEEPQLTKHGRKYSAKMIALQVMVATYILGQLLKNFGRRIKPTKASHRAQPMQHWQRQDSKAEIGSRSDPGEPCGGLRAKEVISSACYSWERSSGWWVVEKARSRIRAVRPDR